MKKISKTVVFFGSGPVAASSLEKLAEHFSVEAVITKPRPAHHKYPFPVIEVATKLGLKTFTTQNRTEVDELFMSQSFRSRVGVVIDFGIIISKDVIDCFSLGIVNSHFSLLPKFRGADPISFAILSGEKVTGVSLMTIVEAVDEGPLIAQEAIPISDKMTTPVLTHDLIELSDSLLNKYLPAYMAGTITPYPQSSDNISYTRKLTKADSHLDFNKPTIELERQIRAFLEWPRSRMEIKGKKIIVTKARVAEGRGAPGSLQVIGKQLAVCTVDGMLILEKVIPEGKKEMDSSAFLAGYQID